MFKYLQNILIVDPNIIPFKLIFYTLPFKEEQCVVLNAIFSILYRIGMIIIYNYCTRKLKGLYALFQVTLHKKRAMPNVTMVPLNLCVFVNHRDMCV